MGLQVWPTEQFPLRQIGRLVLDTNIENFHNESEQIAFSPGRVVPGDDTPCLWLSNTARTRLSCMKAPGIEL